MSPRKPPKKVIAIGGDLVKPDVIHQSDLAHMRNLQEMEWLASQAVQKTALGITERLNAGAAIEPGEFTFDERLKMARSRSAVEREGSG